MSCTSLNIPFTLLLWFSAKNLFCLQSLKGGYFHSHFPSLKTLASKFSYFLLLISFTCFSHSFPRSCIQTLSLQRTAPSQIIPISSIPFYHHPSYLSSSLPLVFQFNNSLTLMRTKIFENILLFSLILMLHTGPSRDPMAPTSKYIQKLTIFTTYSTISCLHYCCSLLTGFCILTLVLLCYIVLVASVILFNPAMN